MSWCCNTPFKNTIALASTPGLVPMLYVVAPPDVVVLNTVWFADLAAMFSWICSRTPAVTLPSAESPDENVLP